MAVRTEYDRRTLRGRGFIFIGSDTGPNTIDRAGELLDDSPWQTDMVLYGVLLHEMGHVFGIPHLGQRFGTIMAAEFPELLLMKAFQPILAQVPVEGRTHFFVPGAQQSMCFQPSELTLSDYQNAKAFFGLPDGAVCLRASAMASEGQEPSWFTGMQLESAPVAAGPWTPLGTIDGNATALSASMAVLLWLGPTQQIYDATQIAALGTYGIGPMIVGVSLSGGLFHAAHGTDSAATYTVNPDGSTISGVLNGRIVTVLRLGAASD